jgi:hypothetical protein
MQSKSPDGPRSPSIGVSTIVRRTVGRLQRNARTAQTARTNTVSQPFPYPNQEIKRKLPLYVVGNNRSLMIEPQICLRLHVATTPGVSRVFMDGGLDAQTIRLEGNIVSRTAGVRSIVTRHAGPK